MLVLVCHLSVTPVRACSPAKHGTTQAALDQPNRCPLGRRRCRILTVVDDADIALVIAAIAEGTATSVFVTHPGLLSGASCLTASLGLYLHRARLSAHAHALVALVRGSPARALPLEGRALSRSQASATLSVQAALSAVGSGQGGGIGYTTPFILGSSTLGNAHLG